MKIFPICFYYITVLIFLIFFAGCTIFKAPVTPPFGGTFTSISSPYNGQLNKTVGIKRGQASSKSLLFGLFAWGDCSVMKAARNGNIKVVNYISYELTNVLGIFTVWTTNSYGE